MADSPSTLKERLEAIAKLTGSASETVLANAGMLEELSKEINLLLKRAMNTFEQLSSSRESYSLTEEMFKDMIIDASRIEEAFLLSQNRMKIMAELGKTHKQYNVFDPRWFVGDEALSAMQGEIQMPSEDHIIIELPLMAKGIRKNSYKTIGTYYTRIVNRLLISAIESKKIPSIFPARTIVFQHLLPESDAQYNEPDCDNIYTKKVLDAIRCKLYFSDAMTEVTTIYMGEVTEGPAVTKIHLFSEKNIREWLKTC
jgi:hypothetical protein